MPARRPLFAFAVLLLPLSAMAQILPPLDSTGTTLAPEPSGGPAAQLSITNTRSLNFGRFVAGDGGALTVAPNGGRSRSGSVVLMNSAAAGSAGFSVVTMNGSGATKSVVVSLPADGEVFLANGAVTMAVGNFVSGSGTLVTLPPSGVLLDVGATLSIAPNQPAGSYTGSFQVTVNYQ